MRIVQLAHESLGRLAENLLIRNRVDEVVRDARPHLVEHARALVGAVVAPQPALQ